MLEYQVISSLGGWLIFGAYAFLMSLIVWFATRPDRSSEEHLVAGRTVSTWAGAFSIAVTWIWAPAIFICSQKAYQDGIAGLFWFTVPNVICFFTFVPVARRIREAIPNGYSLPDYIWWRFSEDKWVHIAFLVVAFGYQLGSPIINGLAGGMLMHAITGINLTACIVLVPLIALVYSLWRGLPASIVTDVIQMIMILGIAFVLVPWVVQTVGGVDIAFAGIYGSSSPKSIFDPWVFYTFGIPTTIGLIAGPLCDQMFMQRVMATRYENISKTFICGGILFGVVPVALSVFGFIAASPDLQAQFQGTDPQLISLAVVQSYLPNWTLYGFALMVLCALSSTLDSGYCAAGSLFSVDVYRRYLNPAASDTQIIAASRFAMVVIAALGILVSLIPGLKLVNIFLIYGALAGSALVPTLFAVFAKHIKASCVFLALVLSLIVSVPLSTYANLSGNPHMVVFASVVGPIIALVVCAIGMRQCIRHVTC